MQRLTEKRNGMNVIPLRNAVCGLDMPYWKISKESDIQQFLSGDAADRLAAYEDAEEEGRLVVLPKKLYEAVNIPVVYGITEWEVTGCRYYDGEISAYTVKNSCTLSIISCQEIGDRVFLTREEAEAKLREVEHET